MAKTVKKLSATGMGKLTEPGLHHDGEGLYFQVTPKGSRSWLFRFMLHGKPRGMGLGPYPAISLGTARELARDARGIVKQGRDPIKEREDAVAETKAAAAHSVTFEKATEGLIAKLKPTWTNPKSETQWTNTIETYCKPIFKDTPVAQITTEMVLDVFKRDDFWTKKTDTAKKLRGRLEMIFDWAKANNFRTGENPARWKGHLANFLPSPGHMRERKHFDALPYAQASTFMSKLRERKEIAAQGLQFTILTAARSAMVRGAMWDEIDWKNKIWTCPAERMKGKKGKREPHKVPLSDAAFAILKARLKLKDGPMIFPGRNGKPMSDMTMRGVLRRMKRKDIDVHGFRSTFSDWAHETTKHDNHTIEISLAHTVGSEVERAYRRGDMFAKRVAIMEDWAKFCGA